MSKRTQLATTFTKAEVVAVDKLIAQLRYGADASALIRDPAIASAHRKFLLMREKSEGCAT